MEVRQALETMIGFFRREEIPFVVVGAVALHGYGLSRATYDLDFMVDLEDQPRVVEFLESQGYRTLHRSKGFSNHAHPLTARGAIELRPRHAALGRPGAARAAEKAASVSTIS